MESTLICFTYLTKSSGRCSSSTPVTSRNRKASNITYWPQPPHPPFPTHDPTSIRHRHTFTTIPTKIGARSFLTLLSPPCTHPTLPATRPVSRPPKLAIPGITSVASPPSNLPHHIPLHSIITHLHSCHGKTSPNHCRFN
ncbi:hypothetical protein BS50DRAFT_311205 [Corynespora cassiicola Philippines]|uniref:Uncharacterized protein n=1 Tax=Corynespora cassiicola Philippines TaxID=1448308 RepID=A0A2T2NY60_CORCC|nr:hypothetical protein BS50DRAFT_311205 [Corynespora cassiicola Philippines]